MRQGKQGCVSLFSHTPEWLCVCASLTQGLECSSLAILADAGAGVTLLFFKGGMTLCQAVYAWKSR